MLQAIGNPFTFVFLCFAIALGANRERWWTVLLPLPFAWWSSGAIGVVLMAVGWLAAYGVALLWSRRARG